MWGARRSLGVQAPRSPAGGRPAPRQAHGRAVCRDPYGNVGANTGTPPRLSHRDDDPVLHQPGGQNCPNLGPQPLGTSPCQAPTLPGCPPWGGDGDRPPCPGGAGRDMVGAMVPTAPGLALTRSRDSGLRLRAAAPALGARRRHRHRQRDETSRMPTSGATRRTELGRSLKSSLKGRAGQGKAWGCRPPATTSPQPHTAGVPLPGDTDVPGKDLPGAACGEAGRC